MQIVPRTSYKFMKIGNGIPNFHKLRLVDTVKAATINSMINRLLQKKLIQMAKSFPAVSVTGPRQSGKTTLVKKTFPEYAVLPGFRFFIVLFCWIVLVGRRFLGVESLRLCNRKLVWLAIRSCC